MAAGNERVRIAAIGDLHVRETSGSAYRGLLADACEQADVLVLCGDLTDHGLPEQAQVLAEELITCKLPIVAVLGNHDCESDQSDEVKRILGRAGVNVLDGESMEIHGVGFAGVKGFCGGFDDRMLQPWGEPIVKQFVYESVNQALNLEGALAKLHNDRTLVVLHYSPTRETVEGESPEVIPYLGSSRLMEPIDRFGASAVVHGHAHYGRPEGRTTKDVPVYNAALPLRRRITPERPYVLIEL